MAAASTSQVRLPDPPAPLLVALTDDLLADIFIRLPDLADLGRARTVCVAFHCIISGHSFLRRLRALRSPPLLGIMSSGHSFLRRLRALPPPPLLGIMSASFIRAEPPHPCSTLARSITPAVIADFWCSFVPSPDRWHYSDFRDGRVLLAAVPEGSGVRPGDYNPRALVREFVVCDPLYRRYRMLPTIPEDLTALVNQSDVVRFTPFLAPSEEGEGAISFRVICLVQCQTKLVYFIFSSIGGSWRAAEFDGWRAVIAESSNPAPKSEAELGDRRYYANGCFCWVMYWSDNLLMLDMRTMEFSAVDIPRIDPICRRAIVEAGEGKFGMFTLFVDTEYEEYALLYTILQNDDKGTTWCVSKAISLPSKYRYNLTGVAGGYLLLQGIPKDLWSSPASERPNLDYFSLNLKTFQVQWFCETDQLIISAPLYVGFPPSLSAPTI